LKNRSGVCSGLSYASSKNIISRDITICNLKTGLIANPDTPGHTCIGIIPFMSSHLTFDNCKISNITGSCDDAHGISLFVADHALVQNC
jgi:hypothetical protein